MGNPRRDHHHLSCSQRRGGDPLFYDRVQSAITPLKQRFEIELLFSNNGSTDRTLQAIHELRKHDSSVHALSLARDFGYEASVARRYATPG